MTGLAGKLFNTLVSVPPYCIMSDQAGTKLKNPHFFQPEDPSMGLHDMNYTADGFAQYGYPLDDGSYRRLHITANIEGEIRSHEAIEFCWSALDHCAILDRLWSFWNRR